MRKFSLADLRSGFLVFLIALPLCLGIAMASSYPPIAGIMTAVVGGIVASLIGSSPLTIKGPAAGMIVIVLGAVTELGAGDPQLGYRRALAVGVAAAICQIIFARFKMGRLGALVPPSVVHGMLAAIGVIIIAKQIHILLGVAPHAKKPLELIAEVPESFLNANPLIALIGFAALATLFLFPLIPNRHFKKIPAALIALGIVVPIGLLWHLEEVHPYIFFGRTFELGPKFLVEIPGQILDAIHFPDFSALSMALGWKYVAMFALVGSVESVLTVIAVDSLDPKKRRSDMDQDLFATGVSNLISSAIGGLPMISEIVRSKANIDNGAESSGSNFFHGVLLLLSVVFFANLLHEIPLAALAAMLIITGFRLASPKEFLKTYKIGSDQLLIFTTTLFTTLATDLLMGVFVGIVLKVVLHLFRGVPFNELLKLNATVHEREEGLVIKVSGAAIFTNYLKLNKLIATHMQKEVKVIVDFSGALVVDHTTLERLHAAQRAYGQKNLVVYGLETLKGISKHELSTRKIARI